MGMALDEITRDVVDRVTAARQSEGVGDASVNRMLAALRAVLRRAAREWDWQDKIPSVRMLPEAKRRIRWIIR
jgi:hypothetical protein